MDRHSSRRSSSRNAMACSLVITLGLLFSVALAGPYWSPIHAVVLAVDRQHRTLTLRYEALETVEGGVRVCAVRDARSLLHLKGGDLIEARAETSQEQWVLDGIRVVGRHASRTPR